MACLTSGFGVLSEYPNPWLIVGYVLVFLALLLFLIWFLSGRSYLDIFESARTINLLVRRWNAVHAVKVVSVLIYLANGLLIAFVLIAFAISGEKKPPCPSELLDRMGSNSGPQGLSNPQPIYAAASRVAIML